MLTAEKARDIVATANQEKFESRMKEIESVIRAKASMGLTEHITFVGEELKDKVVQALLDNGYIVTTVADSNLLEIKW